MSVGMFFLSRYGYQLSRFVVVMLTIIPLVILVRLWRRRIQRKVVLVVELSCGAEQVLTVL